MIKTRSAGGIILRENLILIASQHGTSWSLPKGHLEGEEREIDAAKREIYEETGLTKDITYEVRLLHPVERIIGKFKKGESLDCFYDWYVDMVKLINNKEK